MGSELIAGLLPLVWTTIALPLAAIGFKWLSAKVNATKIGAASALDDYILGKVQVAVANIGTAFLDDIRAGYADGQMTAAEWDTAKMNAHDRAIAELKKLVPANYQAALQTALDSGALDAMIRFAVDARQKAAEATARYESETAAREIARYNREHGK